MGAELPQLRSFFVSNEGRVMEPPGPEEAPGACVELLHRLADSLLAKGFREVYDVKRNHEEKVLVRGDEIIIFLFKMCAVRTNLSREELQLLLNNHVHRDSPHTPPTRG